MSKIELVNHRDYLVLMPPAMCRVLSSAVLNGGLREAASFLNWKVDENPPSPCLPAEEALNLKAAELKLPQPTTAMMTAASMSSLGHCFESRAGLTAECWVTSGLSNVRRVGDIADEEPSPGTINIWLYVNQSLTDAAMVEALMMLTESKVTAVRDAGIFSPLSGLPASGTGTDSHAVFCPDSDSTQAFCGKHTLLGEMIGRVVTTACAISLDKCMNLTSQTESAE
ncbi:adenosylcobinamide amidohydrolase [Pseudomaricurvus sp.]|uniref:adenosylcobinamide amidohydrolase n=1 Tax=Pseudomaricurvus sp. TaxID=2004510 RepID=UPI003F6D1C24